MSNQHWLLAAAGLWLCGGSDGLAATNSALPVSQPYLVDVWGANAEEGLPNAVIAITQTRDGYLWLGTFRGGLVRFDGIRFTTFDENNTPGLNSSTIVSLFEDSKTNLWVGTESAGVAILKDGKIKSFDIGPHSREGRVVSMCEDAQGTVWLYTAGGQLARYRNGQVEVGEFGAQLPSRCRVVTAEKSGPIWVGVDWGLYGLGTATNLGSRELPLEQVLPVQQLDFVLASRNGGYWRLADGRVQKWTTNRLERDFGPYPWAGGVRVTSACEDHDANLIVGTLNSGVFWYDAAGAATHIKGLSHEGVLSLCLDREGNLWVGTDGGGLNRVKRKKFGVAEAGRDWVVQSVCADGEDGLWMGFNGGGATYWKDGVVQDFGRPEGLGLGQNPANPNFSTVFVDRNQSVWVGTSDKGLFLLETNHFQPAPGSQALDRNIQAIYQDRDGRLWVGTQGGLARWDGSEWKVFKAGTNGLSANVVRAIADDADGNLWVGTERGGLNRLRDGKFTEFRVKDGLPGDSITSLLVDREGVLWVGTSSGLGRWHNGKWTRYTEADGLASNRIGYLIEDDQGSLWIGSNSGLMRIPKTALNEFADGKTNRIPCRVYGRADGLPTAACTQGSQPAACRTKDGKLWFPTTKGLAFLDPAQLGFNTNPPPVVIESISVDGQQQNTNSLRTDWLQSVTIPAGREQLEIRYTGLNLSAPDRARFRYRMEGHETAWTDAGKDRVARYPKLPPGEYRFRVIAGNEDGAWNETGSSLAITVLPPFWQTWWFIGLTSVCLLGMIVGIVHYVSTQKLQRQLESLRQQEALEKERARIARDLHDQLGANLTQVALLGELAESDKHSPEDVQAHAQQISQTARDTTNALDEIVWAANPLNDTLESLVTYACKYAQEYLAVAGMRYRLEVPEQLPVVPIPPEVRHNVFLAFKEAVNNVVKHAKASEVRIRLRLQPDEFALEVEDNGRGPAEADTKTGRNGLRNMRKRMEDVGGRFTIAPASPNGTLVRLTAPIRNH